MVQFIDITLLKPHSKNKDIYGEENIDKLALQISNTNFVKELIINENNVIISGHRRYFACMKLGIKRIPCNKIKFKNQIDELERLLLENQAREKTTFQKMKEAEMWENIEKEKANQRVNLGTYPMLHGTQGDEKGKVRDILAKKVGLGSGHTYERAKSAMNKIKELKKEGKEKDVKFLSTILNESARGAKDISNLGSLDMIPDEIKDKVINKEIIVKNAVQMIRDITGIISEDKKKTLKKYSINTINDYSLNNIIDDIKNTDKTIDEFDYETMIIEIEAYVNNFIFSINRYVNNENNYTLMGIDNKNKLIDLLKKIETTTRKIKNKIY